MLGKKTSTALVSMALVRARFCELMAGELAGPSTDYFLMGLLSLMDVLLSQPMSAVLAQLPISSECRAALEGQENSLSRILQLMVACERGEWAFEPSVLHPEHCESESGASIHKLLMGEKLYLGA